ncbi:unnamed protein product [Caenorhabditis auriculariae]|uniref:EF-hand domain-containing protein n=1 Tax=Caenorhabditis auriculariae TaxID=2777116 RepID=A0A8S1H7Z2_9PELO|nr:unnamed protein product [Caenorhabditis auriculariae]
MSFTRTFSLLFLWKATILSNLSVRSHVSPSEEHLLSWRHRLGVNARGKLATLTERPRPDPCAQSQYRLDYDLFAQVFPRLLPWPVSDIFVIRVFRLLDISESGLLTFRDLAMTLSILLRGEATDKLALFYKCHLPPAFNMSDLDEIAPLDDDRNRDADEPEEALEAAEALGTPKKKTAPLPERFIPIPPREHLASVAKPKSVGSPPQGGTSRTRHDTPSSAVMIESDAESLIDLIAARSIGSCPSEHSHERIHLGDEASEDSFSLVDESIEKMKHLRATTLAAPEAMTTRMEIKMLPIMSQVQFIQFWKTFYDLLSGKETDQKVFHSLAVVATLLLQLGETHKELQAKLEAEIADAMKEVEIEEKEKEKEDEEEEFEEDQEIDPAEVQRRRIGDMKSCVADGEWRVNLEQILASVLSEQPLADFFETKYSLDALIKRYYKTRFSTSLKDDFLAL